MRSLSLPVPVVLFIRRLFNVFSSITISNQYYLLQKTEANSGKDEKIKAEGSLTVSEVLAVHGHPVNSTTYSHRGRLKPWPWSTASRQSGTPRVTRALSSVDEVKEKDSFEDIRNLSEKAIPPSNPVPSSPPGSPQRPPPKTSVEPLPPIYTLMNNPMLFDPIRIPRNPVILCHGLYGYDVRGPSSFPMLQLHYWANVLKVLKKKIGAEVIVTGVPGTGSIESRAERLNVYLSEKARGRDVNFMAHSMGGLDCRHLISHVQPKEYNPISLTTICTPHQGSPFMDWCKENLGLGKLQREVKDATRKASEATNTASGFSLSNLPSSLTTFLLSVLDSPAYANLTTNYLRDVFNPATPDDPRVRYYSIAARTDSMSVLHPLWLPKTILDGIEARERDDHPNAEGIDWGNDGLVTVRSAKWGEFLGTMEGCDHWDVRGGGGLGPDAEWNVDLTLPSALKNSLSDPLSHINWKDWARFVGSWRKEDVQREKNERETPPQPHQALAIETAESSPVETRAASPSPSETSILKAMQQESKSSDAEDMVLKSSTDKISAVFDWISEQVASSRKDSDSDSSKPSLPSDLQINSSESSSSSLSQTAQEAEKQRVSAKKSIEAKDERMKFDLERFYIALCRKLYDDGL